MKEISGLSSTHYNAMFYVSIVEAWKSFLSTGNDAIGLQRYNFLCKKCHLALPFLQPMSVPALVG